MTYVEFDSFFEPMEPLELAKFNELMEFINRMPFSTELVGEQIIFKDKDGELMMVLGKGWIEKP